MKFKLVIAPDQEETVIATVHQRSAFTDQLEAFVTDSHTDTIPAYTEDDMVLLRICDIACITVLNGKTYAVDTQNRHYRLKYRLYELEPLLPASFLRINKSSLANEAQLERFAVNYTGSVDAVFRCGYTEYVSRRCFAQIKRRFREK
jgi:DNA-binding LytR/AlgR family response regulator